MLRIPDEKIRELLLKEGVITETLWREIINEAQRKEQSATEVLIARNIITTDYFYNLMAGFFVVDRANINLQRFDEKVFYLLPEEIARKRRAVIFGHDPEGTLFVAMEDPGDLETADFLGRYLKTKIKIFLASEDDLNKAFTFYGRKSAEEFKKTIEENIAVSLRSKAQGIEKAAVEVPIVAIVDNLIAYAIASRASDIHIESLEQEIMVRNRIDGVLHEVIRIPKEVHPAVIARIKLLATLKLDEHSRPQDGRFRHKVGKDLMDMRVAIMPTFYGEKVEMRLLASTERPLSLEELGMLEDMAAVVQENIKKTYGMLLISGPTGSGKTTTLYSILSILNRPEVNIVTVEDPIEYDMKYINQTQINPQAGITFASGLRALVRQDPNIIMVGEIRDDETAEIAVQSALTGHLVLSSVHTNDASTSIPRLIDMKVVPFLVAAVLNLVVAQRLVRRICLSCIVSYEPPPGLLETIKKQLTELDSAIKLPNLLYKGKGCSSCGDSGYRGRLGIFESLNISEEIRKIIVSPNFSLDALRIQSKKEGMITMFEDGLRKARRGMTTIDEVLRVIRE